MPSGLLPEPDTGPGEEGGKITILTLGYFKPSKGIGYLIKAYQALPDRNRKRSRLVIAGTGKREERLKELASGTEGILFPGYVSGKEKANCYGRANLFVLPSLHDPWGLVVNEAMHYGLPVITTEATGAKEMISDNGIVVEPGNVEDLKAALERLIEDGELRQQMGERSRKLASNLTVDSAGETFHEAIEYCLKRGTDEDSL